MGTRTSQNSNADDSNKDNNMDVTATDGDNDKEDQENNGTTSKEQDEQDQDSSNGSGKQKKDDEGDPSRDSDHPEDGDSSNNSGEQEKQHQQKEKTAHWISSNKRKSDSKPLPVRPLKRPRGMRGLLQQLPEMPLDVVYEIFGQLYPLDILNLARTTKELRSMLMSRTSTSIWRRARDNIEDLPDCPKDLSEPQYADLAFGRNCYYCLRNLPKLHIVWDARVKCCTPCVPMEFITFTARGDGWKSKQPYPERLAVLLPTILLFQGRRLNEYAFRELHETWCARMTSLADEKARERWVKKEIAKRRMIHKDTNGCQRWLERYKVKKEEEKEQQIEVRKAIVMKRLRNSYWGKELAVNSKCKPLEVATVVKACQKELTDRILTNLDKHLNDFMKEAQDERLFLQRAKVMEARLPVLKQEYADWVSKLPPNAIYPPLSEVYGFREIQSIFFEELSGECPKDHFAVLHSSSELFLRRWDKKIRDKLIQLIKKADIPDYVFKAETVLNLATTFFACSNHCHSQGYPRISMHTCATGCRREFEIPFYSEERVLSNTIGMVDWNQFNRISFDTKVFKIVTALVQLCRYDPMTTTAEKLDEANPIFECAACSDDDGRATMSWCSVIAHQRSTHKESPTDTSKLQLLDEKEAVTARLGIAELQERLLWKNNHLDTVICTHCRQTGSMKKLMKHVRKTHGKLTPSKEDIVLNFNKDQTPPLYRLWPPRELLYPDEPTVEP